MVVREVWVGGEGKTTALPVPRLPEIAQCELTGGSRPGSPFSIPHPMPMVTKNEVEKAMIVTLFGRLSLVQPPLESHGVSSQR